MHLVGNMLYLWVFGDNVEDAIGHVGFTCLYLVCGLLGFVAHAVIHPDSHLPVVGASGAISGVLGGWVVMPLMFAAMLEAEDAMVAFEAHVSGFLAGAVLVPVFKRGGGLRCVRHFRSNPPRAGRDRERRLHSHRPA